MNKWINQFKITNWWNPLDNIGYVILVWILSFGKIQLQISKGAYLKKWKKTLKFGFFGFFNDFDKKVSGIGEDQKQWKESGSLIITMSNV